MIIVNIVCLIYGLLLLTSSSDRDKFNGKVIVILATIALALELYIKGGLL